MAGSGQGAEAFVAVWQRQGRMGVPVGSGGDGFLCGGPCLCGQGPRGGRLRGAWGCVLCGAACVELRVGGVLCGGLCMCYVCWVCEGGLSCGGLCVWWGPAWMSVCVGGVSGVLCGGVCVCVCARAGFICLFGGCLGLFWDFYLRHLSRFRQVLGLDLYN